MWDDSRGLSQGPKNVLAPQKLTALKLSPAPNSMEDPVVTCLCAMTYRLQDQSKLTVRLPSTKTRCG